MATPQQNAAAIVAHAATLDDMVAQFRAIKADIDAREAEIRRSQLGRDFAKAGQQRLALYSHGLMDRASNGPDPSVSARATSAWAEFL